MMKRKLQGATGTLVENVPVATATCEVASEIIGSNDDLCPLLSKARKEPGPDANHKRCSAAL